ncbi:MAG TPA: S1 RNA-binding domain-containing protein [Candidatus Aquilonibacter sp.]|nr:S1 RNA-binding domain-containing protein [Candidatus Aquilonibacter sp.]
MMEHEEQLSTPAPIVPQPEAPLAESAPAPLAREPQAATAEPEAPETAPDAAAADATPQPSTQAHAQAQASEGRKRAQEAWARISGAKDTGDTIAANVKSEIKGGLLLDIEGYRAFLPASQTRAPKGEGLASFVGTEIPVKVIDVDQKRKRLVVSHRRAAEQERRAARQALLSSLHIGEERNATVVRIADFGAFVDLGGVDALVPIGELAFERLDKPTDAVNIGDSFPVKVLRIDDNGKKIAVSRKAALPDPWRDHAGVLKHGTVTEGHVIAKEPRLQVEIAPGVIGSISDREANPDEYEIGEAVEVTVRSVDYRNRRIRLSTTHSANVYSSGSFAPLGKELGG